MLFHGLNDDFDVDKLNYPVHPGTRRYLERNEPSFIERYAEVIGVGFTIAFTLIGALVTLRNWNIQRKKDRIDVYYEKLLQIRRSIPRIESPEGVNRTLTEVRDIQEEAFQLLIDEKVSADESFRIFITLCNDVAREVENQLLF